MKLSPITNKTINFESTNFVDFNYKYSNKQKKLQIAIERFFHSQDNVIKIGEGVGGETYKFLDWDLNNFVIKTTKKNYIDNYSQEFNNLNSIPVDKIGGQEAVARVYDYYSGKFALISTLVQGKPASVKNQYNDSHLKSLFEKMFELDKRGIYHGDLNGKNILLNNSGNVNFIDYQWTQKVQEIDFYNDEKILKLLLPRNVFPENAQMFEMASLPYYIENLSFSSDKEKFLKRYLQAKAVYHNRRAQYISTRQHTWYMDEKFLVRQSVKQERAKSNVYKNPDDSVLKLELKKIQFLSDYRDAYSHVDTNMPDRNIIPSSSAYLCAISSVQDFRREISRELKHCYNSDKIEYLKSLLEYGDFWYTNLKNYTSDTFEYVMRAITNHLNQEEGRHRFYINERNPREITPNRDILSNVSPKYKTIFDRNFDVQYGIQSAICTLYDDTASNIYNILRYDTKSMHNIDKIRSVSKESKMFNSSSQYLDLLNVSQVGVLKIREFYSYVRHNIASYSASQKLNNLLENSTQFTKNLFNNIFNGLKYEYAENIIVKGYNGMRQFKGRI